MSLTATPAPATAQGFCFGGRPSSTCSTVVLFELHVHWPLVQTGRVQVDSFTVNGERRVFRQRIETFGWSVGADVGLASRWSESWDVGVSVGKVLFIGEGRTVVAGRLRRHLRSGLTLDLKPGVFVHESGKVGGLLGARLFGGSWGMASLRWEAMGVDPYRRSSGSETEVDPGGFQQALSGGVGLTQEAGGVGLLALTAAAVALAAVLAGATG